MFEKINSLPEFLNTQDLVELGLYSSRNATYFARLHGNGPQFVKVGHRILYPKTSILHFLEHSLQESNHRLEAKHHNETA